MNKLICIGLAGLITCAAQADSQLRAQLQGQYNRIAQVAITDITQLVPKAAALLTSDFRWVEPAGSEYNREFYLGAQTKAVERISKVFSAKNEILSYQEDGIYVRCRVKSTQVYRRKGFSSDRHIGVSVSDDVWVRTIHGWKMYKSVGIRDSDTIVMRNGVSQSAAVMTARMTSAGVVQPALALALPSSSIVR